MEPPQVGVDLIAGSLIKNPWRWTCSNWWLYRRRADLVDRAANRMTTPGIGAECGSTLGNNRLLYQGFLYGTTCHRAGTQNSGVLCWNAGGTWISNVSGIFGTSLRYHPND